MSESRDIVTKFNDKVMVNDIRSLGIDMIYNAGSGHPGIVLGAAPILYTLFTYHLKFDLNHSDWFNRDRFVMSSGHGSALLYSVLFCTTEEYTLRDLKDFRNIYSKTSGHPIYNVNNRIECTTGPLGQGIGNAVGMAMAGKFLANKFSSKKVDLFDYNVYAFCGDGDLMEGVSYEALSLAGKYNLDNLILLYDDNHVSLDGEVTEIEENGFIGMLESFGFEVIDGVDGENVKDINRAINKAKKSDSPSVIVFDTTIGKYSKYEGTNRIHGSLEEEDYKLIKESLESEGSFSFDKVNMALYRQFVKERCDSLYDDWNKDYEEYIKSVSNEKANELNLIINGEDINLRLDSVIDTDKLFVDKTLRDINYQVMNVISTFVPNFLCGNADVSNSTKAYLKNKGDFGENNYVGRNISFGVREHAMGAILNGMALCNFRVCGSTYLAFSDYMRPAIRMSAMMDLPVTYIFTHDSIMVGQDGETHEPVEQLGSLRSIPNFTVYRPCDHKELIGCWNEILAKKKPCALILPRQHVDVVEFSNPLGISYGAYIVSEVKKSLDVILVATGSEVSMALKLKEELLKNYIEARVVSMPNMENFLSQDEDYRNEVLPKGYKVMVLEFSNDSAWYRFINNSNDFLGVVNFGISANSEDILKELELDISSLVIRIKNSV